MRKSLWLLSVALLMALVSAISNPVNAQDDFKVSNLKITPDSVKEGEPVTITAKVTNKGEKEGNYTFELKINDTVEDTKTIKKLAPGKSSTVSFTVTKDTAGDYIVDVNGLQGSFTITKSFWGVFPTYLWIIVGAIMGVLVLFIIVLIAIPSGKKQAGTAPRTKKGGRQAQAPMPMPMPMPTPTATPTAMPTAPPTAAPLPTPTAGPMAVPHRPPTTRAIFSVSNLTITPNQVKEGDPITISAIVANSGTDSGHYSLVLRINGVVEGINELALAPGTSQPAVFTVIKDIAGTYYVEVDGTSGTFVVIALVPAHFSVSNMVIAPERVKQGESIIISAVVTNSGEIAGNYSVVLKIKDVADNIQEIHLGPGESQRVAFTVNKDTPGFYPVDLEGLSGRFVVEMEWNE